MTCSTSHCLMTVLGIYGMNICMYVYSWLLPHRTLFVTHSWKVNLSVVAYTSLNVRIWALWCDRPLIVGDTEDTFSSLLCTIILSMAIFVLFWILVAQNIAYFSLYFFNNEASCFLLGSFSEIIVFMFPQIKNNSLDIYRCLKAFFKLFINWLQSPVGMQFKFDIQRTVHRDIFL